MDAAAPSRVSRTRRRWIVAACSTAMFMGAVEATIVATAMPTIVGVLGGFHLFSWVFAAYVLAQCVTIPLCGRLTDLYGRKPVFFAGTALFVVASALCGFSTNMTMLVACRAVQGIGAGGFLPAANTIIGDIYGAEERARMQGYLGTIWGVAAMAGPVIGAFLIAAFGWQTVFWINIPFGCIAIAVLAAALDEVPASRAAQVDYRGALLLVLGTAALVVALVDWPQLGTIWVVLLVVASVALLGLLVRHESRIADPMLPLELARNRTVSASLVGALSIGAVMMSAGAFLPTYVQGVMGRAPLVAGLAACASSVGWTVGGTVVGGLLLRSSYRGMAILGGAMLVVGSLVLVLLDPARGPLWAATGAFIVGLGMGLSNTTFLVAAQSSVAWNRRGIATSLSLFMRLLGQSLGAALAGGVVNEALVGSGSGLNGLIDRLMQPELRQALAPAELAQLTGLVAGALHRTYLLAGVIALVALALAFALPASVNPTRAAR